MGLKGNAAIVGLQTIGGKTRVTVNTWLERATFGLYRRGNAVTSEKILPVRFVPLVSGD